MPLLKFKSKVKTKIKIGKSKTIYHLGASIKDLGNKWFAFSKLEDDNLELVQKVNNITDSK